MLELAHKLADSDAKFFGGWVLAGVEAHIHGEAVKLENNVLLAKERKAMIQVVGTAADGSVAKELRVYDDGEKLAAYVGAANVFVIK